MVDFSKLLRQRREKTSMATKKAGSKTTAMAKYDAELAALAQQATKTEENVGAGGNQIGTGGGVLTYKGAEIPGNKMNVVVLDHIICYADYEGEYDPKNPQAPRCFAFGRDEKTLVPHEKSAEKQNDDCKSCPMNEWASADRGEGKHCKNSRRLALIPQGDLENIGDAEVAFISVPVTSVKAWAGYVRQTAEVLKRPPLGVITEISLKPQKEGGFKMEFKLIESVEDSDIGALLEKSKAIQKDLFAPFVQIERAEKPAARRGKATKPAAKKRSKF
jgi:hypothetical protein